MEINKKIKEILNNCNAKGFFLIDKKVWDLYKNNFDFLSAGNHLLIAACEENKTIESCEKIWLKMLGGRYERDDVFFAIGGGLVGDVGGFAASTFKRGMRLVHIPTTLLAMIDSSIGAKTAVNLDYHKNIIGSFYQADYELLETQFLKTLSHDDVLSGLGELIKTAALYDEKLFSKIEELGCDAAYEEACIIRARELKKGVCDRDILEKNERVYLNFGHSFGHALEAYYHKKGEHNIKHGICVAKGMLMAGNIAHNKGLMSTQAHKRLKTLIKKCGYPSLPAYDRGKVLSYIKSDKKIKNGILRLVYIPEIARRGLLSIDIKELGELSWED